MSDILQLAAEALADAAKATPGPWSAEPDADLEPSAGDTRVCYVADGKTCEWCIALAGDTVNGDGAAWTPETIARWQADARFIAAARSREPQLAEACIAMAKEVERLQLQRAGLLEQCAQQTERLSTWEADAHRCHAQLDAVVAQAAQNQRKLAAMTTARDAACDLVDEACSGKLGDERHALKAMDALRQVGVAKQ